MATYVNYCEVFNKDFNQKSSFPQLEVFVNTEREKFCQIKRFCIHSSLFTLQVSTNYFKANTFCCQSLIRKKNCLFFVYKQGQNILNLLLKKYIHLFFQRDSLQNNTVFFLSESLPNLQNYGLYIHPSIPLLVSPTFLSKGRNRNHCLIITFSLLYTG